MRRLMLISAFALFVVMAPGVYLWAQHGGGHGGGGGGHAGGGFGGGHAGFSGGHGGGFSGGGRVSGGVRSTPNFAGGASRGFARGPAFYPRSSTRAFSRPLNRPFLHDGFRGSRTRNFGFRNGCFGIPCRGFGLYSPWGYGYYDPYWYDPYWFWDSDSSDDSGYDNGYDQDVAAAAEMNRQSIAQRAEEQQMMRQEQADGDQDAYARPVRPRAVPREAEGAPILPDTMLVFRDQHKQEVHNYAIIGQTLWSFAPQHTEKIPLSDLDLAATTKANEERGVTFRVPDGGEGQ